MKTIDFNTAYEQFRSSHSSNKHIATLSALSFLHFLKDNNYLLIQTPPVEIANETSTQAALKAFPVSEYQDGYGTEDSNEKRREGFIVGAEWQKQLCCKYRLVRLHNLY